MTEHELFVRAEDTIQKLYQNRELEALQQVKELLPVLQEMIQKLVAEQINNDTMRFFQMLKELVENFKNQDMLGMADCLQENVFDLIRYYSEYEKIIQ